MKFILGIRSLISASLVSIALPAVGALPHQKTLPIGLAPGEKPVRSETTVAPIAMPQGSIHSLGEWETAEAAMTLWDNPSWIRALATHGPLKLLSDDAKATQYWKGFLATHKIPDGSVSYYEVPTDSIWIRDYGPWFIIDGAGAMGLIDNIYNRPRPKDDLVPDFIGKKLGVPVYKTGLVHTGGNYYNDGLGNAFSSTLVYSENTNLGSAEIQKRMKSFLGIERYTTSPLAPKITIEHMDTFGKLVAPDTWVFSEFPQNSRYRKDSETMLALLKTLKSPYGTPYKIFRMPMLARTNNGEDFKAYINSFISNKALYFPIYNSPTDDKARAVYQAALPGYDIVGVDAMDTEWGDSVHCRSRNLMSRNTVFIFPRVTNEVIDAQHDIVIEAEIFASPGATLNQAMIHWDSHGDAQTAIAMEPVGDHKYRGVIPAQSSGEHVRFFIEATDSVGKRKTAPALAPSMRIEMDVK